MPDATPPQDAQPPRSGFTLDLSSGAAGKAKRPKGFAPVVQQTINLTTKKVDAAPTPSATPREVPRAEQKRAGTGENGPGRNEPRRTEARDERRPSGGGTSLAELLDEATLARLRGR